MPSIMRGSRDALAALQDRESFRDRVQKIISRAGGEGLSTVYLRVLHLAAFNVRNGADAGDEVLRLVASRLREELGRHAVARFESGSFAAVAPTNEVERIVGEINRDFPSSGEADGLVLKAGYCEIAGLTITEAVKRARYAFDDIRYDSPALSRLFDKGLETAYLRRSYVVDHLDDAIARGEIRAFAQPIVRVLTGQICEVEVLARWESEEFGFLRPDEFVPELERSQLIHKLDSEVVRLACRQWREAHDLGINVPFGINLSRLDFELTDMFAVVTEAMSRYGVPVDQVHVEVTESALSHSGNILQEGIERFRRAGFELYLDDFGSGYSSLQVLEGKSFDVVKLDMSLLREVETNERARVIVADAVSMVKRLSLQTLCEGVETEEQFLFLKGVGCEKAQGYFFGKPVSHEEIMAHLDETAPLHETAEDQRYYDSIGRVNLIDGTRSSVHGVEAAHFLGTQPFALIEVRGQSFSFLSANVAFIRSVASTAFKTLEGVTEHLSSDLSDLRNKVLYAASKALSLGTAQQFDFVIEGRFCTAGLSYVESSPGRVAYLLEILSATRYSKFNDFKLLENSLRFLYTIFKRIDLLDETDHTWHNIYLNVPHYTPQQATATPIDEIHAFCQTFIHPDDRARFLEFYDLDSVERRIARQATSHLSDVFFALSDTNRYEEQLFMLIPVSMGGHRQYLSCLRDLDVEGLARQTAGGKGRISDDVLLSGILDATDRYVYWKDDRLRYVGANRQYLEYFGVGSPDEILGRTDDELGWAPSDQATREERRVLLGEQVLDVDSFTRRQGTLRSVRVSRIPLWREGKVIGLVGFVEDRGPYVSARTLSEDEIDFVM